MELLGYSLAGIIAAAVSWIPLFLVDAATYLISAISLLGVPDIAARTRTKTLHLGRDIVEGAKFVIANGVLRSTMALTLVATVFFGMTTTILVVMAYGPLHAGASGYGLIEAAIGAGAIVGAVGTGVRMSATMAVLITASVTWAAVMREDTGAEASSTTTAPSTM